MMRLVLFIETSTALVLKDVGVTNTVTSSVVSPVVSSAATTVAHPGGAVTTTDPIAGTKTTHRVDGSTTTKDSSGRVVTVDTDGSRTTAEVDGRTTTEYADGKKSTRHSDGTVTTENPDGSRSTRHPITGRVTTQHPNGVITSTDPAPTVAEPVPAVADTAVTVTGLPNQDMAAPTVTPDGSNGSVISKRVNPHKARPPHHVKLLNDLAEVIDDKQAKVVAHQEGLAKSANECGRVKAALSNCYDELTGLKSDLNDALRNKTVSDREKQVAVTPLAPASSG